MLQPDFQVEQLYNSSSDYAVGTRDFEYEPLPMPIFFNAVVCAKLENMPLFPSHLLCHCRYCWTSFGEEALHVVLCGLRPSITYVDFAIQTELTSATFNKSVGPSKPLKAERPF